MQLTNIEYGSLASSAILNNNFVYLDEKIAETNTSLNSSISAILSNIETINSRLSQLANEISDTRSTFELTITDFRTKSLNTFNKITMLPNWTSLSTIIDLTSFVSPSNGYLLVIPKNNASGNIKINNFEFALKQIVNAYDNASEMLTLPLKKDDVVATSVEMTNSYFLPAINIISTEL